MKFKTQKEKRAFRMGCAAGKKQAAKKSQMPPVVKTLGIKGKPIGVIPYDLGKAKCDYADALKAQDIAQGKTVRSDKYYHDKAWKALNMDVQLKARGFK
ncbi:hypothetical protein [Pumilibacter muris]|uniref:hypothetical protein n=1 Tax=Pumilibacter muris TaxID=2941510 RepID=UPI00203BC675|nr:hypothetical protein [Pumilibacter muris]